MGNTPPALCKAASEGQYLLVKELLEDKNVQINDTDINGNTALTLAIKNRHYEIAKYLIESGADLCKFVPNGQSPLSAAVEQKNISFITHLLDHGAGPTIQTAFRTAVENGFLEIVQLLKQRGASVNVTYKDGYSPLTIATEKEHLKIVKYLIEQGANINEADVKGRIALRIAASNSSFQIVKYLIDKGANRDIAKKELEQYAERNEDVDFYLNKGENCISVTGSGHDC